MKSLFGINTEFQRTLIELEQYCMDNGTDVVPDEFLERLEVNKDELQEKAEGYFYKMQELKSEIDLLKNESKRLAAKAKTKEKLIDNLKQILGASIMLFGEETKTGFKYKHPKFSASAKKEQKIIIEDIEKLPAEYVKEVTTKKADGAAVKKAILAGQEIEGAHIKSDKINLSFR